jgi:hypothetical protein
VAQSVSDDDDEEVKVNGVQNHHHQDVMQLLGEGLTDKNLMNA